MKRICPKCKGHVRWDDEPLRAGELCRACDPDRLTVVPFSCFDFIFCGWIIVAGVHGFLAFCSWVLSHVAWKP